jgi:UDP-N-acetylglucosamine/UDP-N-acetylgalactosamine diphosphorylase
MLTVEEARERLDSVGQGHVLAWWDGLDQARRAALLAQIAAMEIESLPGLVERYVKHKPAFALPAGVMPARYYPFDPASRVRPYDAAWYSAAGQALLAAGKIGAFVVAGGQGTRLGYDGPKGCYPCTPVTGASLFEVFARQILAAQRRFGREIPWYVMTSPLNHEATASFFRRNNHFGLSPGDVMFFQQGVMPSFDIATGRLLMASKHEIATNPDGHGGSLKALAVSGALSDMKKRGIEHVSYFQVDNPLVRAVDPVFLGLHASAADSSGQMSSKMVPKAYAEEKLGVFCAVPGPAGERIEVIEYSDLPAELARERLADGSLRFNAGSIALHAIGVSFIDRLNNDPAFSLPYHRAEKKVPCIDPKTGAAVEPASPNGVKLERFVFDALAFCDRSVVYETSRDEEFAPIKNASGVDSPESSKLLQTARAARWLEGAGVRVPRKPDGSPDCVIEVSPLTASSREELRGRPLPGAIERGASVTL